jgi:hypothetical protein
MYRFISLSHLLVIFLIVDFISSFSIHVDFDMLSMNVSKFENTLMALLNFMASSAVSELCIDVIGSDSDIMFHRDFGKYQYFVISFFRLFNSV